MKILEEFSNYTVNRYGDIFSFWNTTCKKLTPFDRGNGYLAVNLCNGKIRKTFSVHTIVANTFIENVKNAPCVNHKDGNKLNNAVDNLEWCTYSENSKHSINVLNRWPRKGRTGQYNQETSKPILQYDVTGVFIKEFPSMHEVTRKLGIDFRLISKCCLKNVNGGNSKSKGFIWKYKGAK